MTQTTRNSKNYTRTQNRNFNSQRPQKTENEVKERDMEQVTFYLQNTFRKVTDHLPRAKRDKDGTANEMYYLEREMAYLIVEMNACAPCLQQVYITKVNEMIDTLLVQQKAFRKKSN